MDVNNMQCYVLKYCETLTCGKNVCSVFLQVISFIIVLLDRAVYMV